MTEATVLPLESPELPRVAGQPPAPREHVRRTRPRPRRRVPLPRAEQIIGDPQRPRDLRTGNPRRSAARCTASSLNSALNGRRVRTACCFRTAIGHLRPRTIAGGMLVSVNRGQVQQSAQHRDLLATLSHATVGTMPSRFRRSTVDLVMDVSTSC